MSATITKNEIREILGDRKIFSSTIDDHSDDADLGLDSLALVWLAHRLEEHGISLDPDMDAADFASVNAIHTAISMMIKR